MEKQRKDDQEREILLKAAKVLGNTEIEWFALLLRSFLDSNWYAQNRRCDQPSKKKEG